MSIKEAILWGKAELEIAGIENTSRDAEIILSFTLKKERASLHAYPEYVLTENEEEKYRENILRRQNREPMAYIRGYAHFFGREFLVNEHTLIPREETELLVEEVLRLAKPNDTVIDVGTGSGIIAITLKLERPDLNVFASDISDGALKIAKENSDILGAKINFQQDHLISSVENNSLDIIAANLPYIPPIDELNLMAEVKNFEPHTALFAKDEGLALIYELILTAKDKLKENGRIILEVGMGQSEKVVDFFEKIGYNNISVIKDYAEIERVISAKNPK